MLSGRKNVYPTGGEYRSIEAGLYAQRQAQHVQLDGITVAVVTDRVQRQAGACRGQRQGSSKGMTSRGDFSQAHKVAELS